MIVYKKSLALFITQMFVIPLYSAMEYAFKYNEASNNGIVTQLIMPTKSWILGISVDNQLVTSLSIRSYNTMHTTCVYYIY